MMQKLWQTANKYDTLLTKRKQALLAATIERLQGQELQLIISEIDRRHNHLVLSLPTSTEEAR